MDISKYVGKQLLHGITIIQILKEKQMSQGQ